MISLLCKNKQGLDKKWKQDLLHLKEIIFTSLSCEFKTEYGEELTDLVSLFIALSYSEKSNTYLSSLEIEESTLTSIFPHNQINLRINFTNNEYKTSTAIPAGAEAAESELDSNSLFVDSSVNFDSLEQSSIDTTSVEPRGEAKDSPSVSTSSEAKIPAGITETSMEFFQEYFQESMSVYFPILKRNAVKAQSQLEDIWNATLLPPDKKAAETFLSNVHLYQSEVPLDSIFRLQKAIELYEENSQDDIYTLIENLQENEFLLFSLYRAFQFTNLDETDCFAQFVRDVNLVWGSRHRLSTPPKINFEKYNEKRINTQLRLCSMAIFIKHRNFSLTLKPQLNHNLGIMKATSIFYSHKRVTKKLEFKHKKNK